MKTDIERRVADEMAKFEQQLPLLLRQLPGRWVVFRDGVVYSDHESGPAAYRAAVAQFGAKGGFVVAPVEEIKPLPLSATVGLLRP